MVRQGRVVWSQMGYILGYNRRIFQNVAIWYLKYNSDHLMAKGGMNGAFPREHLCCLGCKTRLLIKPPGRQMRTRSDKIFSELWRAVPKPYKRATRHNSWVLAETWRLVDERVSARRETGGN